MELCQKFDLRFNVIADRFDNYLKDKYDRMQLEKIDLNSLCETAKDHDTKQTLSEDIQKSIRKRD